MIEILAVLQTKFPSMHLIKLTPEECIFEITSAAGTIRRFRLEIKP